MLYINPGVLSTTPQGGRLFYNDVNVVSHCVDTGFLYEVSCFLVFNIIRITGSVGQAYVSE